jgi:hypothetical protein
LRVADVVPPVDKIPRTPVLAGLCSYFSYKGLHDRWDDVFVKIFASEDIVYAESCIAFIITRIKLPNSEPYGWEYLKFLLSEKPSSLLNHQNKEVQQMVEVALRWAFHQYWTIVKDQRYWLEGKFGIRDGWLPYKQMESVWAAANAELLDDILKQLASWVNS